MDIESKVKSHQPPKFYVWLDLEMTGLDTRINRIVEVAVIITDTRLNEIESYEAVIHQPEEVLEKSNAFAKDLHAKNGLYAKVRQSTITEDQAQDEILKIINKHVEPDAIFLAGNSIRADRFFIDSHWPKLSQALHYRMLDVSSLKLIWIANGQPTYKKKEVHRALEDIRESIAELKFYMNKIKF